MWKLCKTGKVSWWMGGGGSCTSFRRQIEIVLHVLFVLRSFHAICQIIKDNFELN